MKTVNVGILGATGVVGREMLKLLEERDFPAASVRLLASAHSAGKKLPFKGQELLIEETTDQSFEGLDIVFGAVENDMAMRFAPAIKAAGAVFVDNSSAFRLDDDVPLVIPEINPEDAFKHKGIIANPNCATIITLMAVNEINRLSPIRAMVCSTYQAVSGAGAGGLAELEVQTKALAKGEEIIPKAFQYQIAENLIPQIGGFTDNLYTSEEMKLQNEGRKILHKPELKVSCTCVRVPVIRSHSISACVYTEDVLDLDTVRKAISSAEGCVLADDPEEKVYPMPLATSGKNEIFVGRIRRDLISDKGIALWCCGDQIRKGAALNAVQIAELFVK